MDPGQSWAECGLCTSGFRWGCFGLSCERPEGVDPLVFAGYLFGRAAALFGNAEMSELGG